MGSTLRRGKSNQALIAIFPIVLILSGLMVYNIYKFFIPDAFRVAKSQRVEALEVLSGYMGVTSKGLPVPQPQTVPRGGSSTLVISHPVDDGPFQLIKGTISAGYMIDQIEMDKMLHLKFSASQIKVESGGQPVDATILIPRTYTDPLTVDAPVVESEEAPQPEFFVNKILLPAPLGTAEELTFTSENGMSIEGSGSIDFLSTQIEFKLDPDSNAWITMPNRYAIQHTAVGTENLDIGILVPLDDGTEPFEITMFGKKVAKVRRR